MSVNAWQAPNTWSADSVVGDAAFSINKESFLSGASVTLPQPVGDVSFNIDKTIINATGSATQVGLNANIAFYIDKLLFVSSASVTLPSPVADMCFSIDYSMIAVGSSSGAQAQTIGTVTAIFKPSKITVSFKS